MAKKINFINGKVVLLNEVVEKVVVVSDGKIIEIGDKIHDDGEIIDCKGNYLAPGFIDSHIHGRNGYDTMDSTVEALNNISNSVVKGGTTSFLATTVTQSIDNTYKAVKNVKENMDKLIGAKIVGVHLEGPFICEEYKGAHQKEFIVPGTIETFKALCKENMDIIKLITIAPEQHQNLELIKWLVQNDVVVSIGHTNATYDQAMESFENGVTRATHVYNAMKGFSHRDPGTVGAIFDNENVYAEIIMDGVHVHFAASRTLMKNKNPEKLVLITDCLMSGGLTDGDYLLGELKVIVKDGVARIESGNLAGSGLSMDEAIKNTLENTWFDLPQVVAMATYNVAKSLNLNDIGLIEVGKKADLVIFDEKINIKQVFVEGESKL